MSAECKFCGMDQDVEPIGAYRSAPIVVHQPAPIVKIGLGQRISSWLWHVELNKKLSKTLLAVLHVSVGLSALGVLLGVLWLLFPGVSRLGMLECKTIFGFSMVDYGVAHHWNEGSDDFAAWWIGIGSLGCPFIAYGLLKLTNYVGKSIIHSIPFKRKEV